MRDLSLRFLSAALILASASCIVDRGAARPDPAGSEAMQPQQPPPAQAPAPAPSAPSKPAPIPASAPPAAAPPQIAQRAGAADQEVDRESEAHGRPVITNLDESGDPIPGTTASQDDDTAEGAPGANASAEQLNQAWPGAKPIDNAKLNGATADNSAPPAAPTALPYTNPQAGDQPEPSADASDETVPPAGTEVDPAAFQKPLRRYGRWVNTPDYGEVWIPYVDNDWQPYSDGTWTNTEYGWTFTSYDPWGWAVWHYGNWGFRAGIGWYWVPGRVWGPAWVSWRWGGGYACWRPIAPWGVWGARWGNRGWVGVNAVHFTEPIRGAMVARASIGVAVSRSQPLAGPVAHPIAGGGFGPSTRAVSQMTGHPVVARPAAQVVAQAHVAARSAYAQASRAAARQSSPAQSNAMQSHPQTAMRQSPIAQRNADRNSQRANRHAGNPGGGQHARGGGHHGGGHGKRHK